MKYSLNNLSDLECISVTQCALCSFLEALVLTKLKGKATVVPVNAMRHAVGVEVGSTQTLDGG